MTGPQHTPVADPFSATRLGPVRLRNHIIKAATFEGRSPKRVVTDELIEFHRTVAAGGVAMTTVAYCAVSREGSTDGHQIVLGPESRDGLVALVDAVHAEGAAISAQIGHAGPVANPAGTKRPALAPSRFLSPGAMRLTRACTESDIARVTEDYAKGAAVLRDAGFDAIEIHLGHNYLLSSFMSPKLNRRKDSWGGSIENRARFARQVVERVRAAAGPDLAIYAKLNMADGVTGGLWVQESLTIAKMLEADGNLDAIELTGGSSLANPMYLFRGDAPIAEMAATLPAPIRAAFKLVGKRFLKTYPFEEAYFLPFARQFRSELTIPLILLGGITSLATVTAAMDEGFDLVAVGRALLREPNLVNDMAADPSRRSLCIHCNKCMPTIFTGTRCVLVDSSPH